MKQRNQMARLCLGAVIAALYTVLTLALPVLSFGPIQFRLAEGMTVLAWLCPEAIPGLTLGCFLSNLIGSPYALDWIMGTLATLIAALWTARVPKRWMAPIPPVLCNMVIVGAEIAWFEGGFTSAFFPSWVFNAATVGLGELLACYILGMLLIGILPRIPYFRGMIPEERLSVTAAQLVTQFSAIKPPCAQWSAPRRSFI